MSDPRHYFDMHGLVVGRQHDVAGMMFPVECAFCGAAYDLGAVTVTARYSDCSCWKTPCCGRATDDRSVGLFGHSRPQFFRLDRDGNREAQR